MFNDPATNDLPLAEHTFTYQTPHDLFDTVGLVTFLVTTLLIIDGVLSPWCTFVTVIAALIALGEK